MSFPLIVDFSSVGVSKVITGSVLKRAIDHTVTAKLDSRGVALITAATVTLQGSQTGVGADDFVITNPTLAEGSTTDRIATAAFDYIINGTSYTSAAETAGHEMSLNHIVSATRFGVIMLYIDAAGAITSLVALANQAYTSAELAHVAADAISPVLGTIYIGRILIDADTGTWTANTDDFSTDLDNAVFLNSQSSFEDIKAHAFDGDEITAQRMGFTIGSACFAHIRLYISTLTGTGIISAWWHAGEAH